MRLVLLAVLASSAFAADVTPPSTDLYGGWLKMYDMKFDEAHQIFKDWKQSHPADPLGPASDATAYLFSELARLGVLESELFTDDGRFQERDKPHLNVQMKTMFDREIERADQLADAALQARAADVNALFVKSLTFGLHADFASLIEKRDLAALKYTKDGRVFADRLMAIDPKAYDAFLGPGIENYLLSLKPAPLRLLLRVTGSMVDREKGIQDLRMTAQYGHYLEPFAKLLLAVAAIRDNNRAGARDLLSELHNRFPNNPLYLRELNRLNAPSK
ncbi:MAG TPA: hypothetical protein VGJ09_17210 [Bryobacteraceae bacterium]|jgi:hypothetical protein